MALVLRKVGITKNMSILKCIKGKHFVTANKQHPAALSSLCTRRARMIKPVVIKKHQKAIHTVHKQIATRIVQRHVRCSTSCPEIVPQARMRVVTPLRSRSLPRDTICHPKQSFRTISLFNSTRINLLISRGYATNCGCPCPFPCGPCGDPRGCNCLPPPCDCPPQCIQYMTGYYYYPYGTWFCGPFHVKNVCVPLKPGGAFPCPCPCAACPASCCPCSACIVPNAADVAGVFSGSIPNVQTNFPSPPNIEFRNPMPEIPKPPRPSSPVQSTMSKFFPFHASSSVSPAPNLKPMEEKQSRPPYPAMACPFSSECRDSKPPFIWPETSGINIPKSHLKKCIRSFMSKSKELNAMFMNSPMGSDVNTLSANKKKTLKVSNRSYSSRTFERTQRSHLEHMSRLKHMMKIHSKNKKELEPLMEKNYEDFNRPLPQHKYDKNRNVPIYS